MLQINISLNGNLLVSETMVMLRDMWEETSFKLERLQTNKNCVEEEEAGLKLRHQPPYHFTFQPRIIGHTGLLFIGVYIYICVMSVTNVYCLVLELYLCQYMCICHVL